MNKRVMILEDNDSARQLLTEIVRSLDAEADIREFSTMEGVYETAMCLHFDLFLLDIIIDNTNPEDISGIRFAEHLRTVSKYEFTPIIFITSLEDPAMYAYSNLHSFSYIEKPFKAEQVRKKIGDALRYRDAGERDNTIFLRKEGILYSVKCSEIVYVESILRELHFHKVDGKEIVIRYKTITELLREADNNCFMQCSRNIVVNKEYIESLDIVNRCIQMRNIEKPIGIGITYQKYVLKELRNDK